MLVIDISVGCFSHEVEITVPTLVQSISVSLHVYVHKCVFVSSGKIQQNSKLYFLKGSKSTHCILLSDCFPAKAKCGPSPSGQEAAGHRGTGVSNQRVPPRPHRGHRCACWVAAAVVPALAQTLISINTSCEPHSSCRRCLPAQFWKISSVLN